MANELRFEGRVAIVTGAGQGLGRSHALLLASRGARVVVNDLGGSSTGGGKSSEAADKVVAEIKAAGGEAVANYDSVEDGAKIVQAALDHFKRVDIVINNAGILRDTSFQKMTEQDWELIYRVHLLGAFRVTHAAWPHMREAGYGRILFTSSAAGIYGNFGQANYSMAKLGLVGFARTLAAEGAKKNVFTNVIAPIAGSRLTETILPKEVTEALRPEYVSPLVAVLAHESCQENGGLFEVGGGFMAKLRWQRTEGARFKLGRNITPELVQSSWERITDFQKASYPEDVTAAMQPVMENLGSKSKGGNEFIDVDAALGYEFPPTSSSYDERDLALYALGVGAARDPLDTQELRYVYENHGDGFMPLPTYAVIPALNSVLKLLSEGKQAPGLNYGFDRVLHGEQYTELLRPLPPRAKLRHQGRIKDIFDKGKNALVVTDIRTFNADTGEELVRNELTTFVRGAGGWGGERGPASDVNVAPEREPDAVITEKTNENQALLYRLSGDWNPLHADPSFANAFGFPKPILHGLCTFGHVARHVLKAFRDGDARYFKSIKVRFADSVFPGETLRTEMWKESPTRILFRCRVLERDKVVISNAAVELHSELPRAAPAPQAPAAAAPTKGESASAQVFAAIGRYVEQHPELVGKVSNVYVFKLTQPDSAWTLDLKNGKGSVSSGAGGKADCTLELTDADFLAMTSGKADPQKLYFGGKLKISGNVMASQKLSFLQKIDPREVAAPAASATPAASGGKPASEAPKKEGTASAPAIFQALQERLAKSPELASEVGGLLQFKLTEPEGAWVVDLRTSPGTVTQGTQPGAVATLKLADEDLLALVKGTAAARELFMKGRLRVDGDVRVAQLLRFLKNLM